MSKSQKVIQVASLPFPGKYVYDKVFRLDTSTGASIKAAPMPLPEDTSIMIGMCGTATKSDGKQVVVYAGGMESSVYSFNGDPATDKTYLYDPELDSWTHGPTLPETRTWGRAVQYEDSFVIVGGAKDSMVDSEYRGSILRYDPDGESWEVLEQRLENPSTAMTALLAPPGFNVECLENE